MTIRQYRRKLTHLDIQEVPVFLTWRLKGSLPPGRHFSNADLTDGERFRRWDRLLDNATVGPLYLAQADIAQLVEEELHRQAGHGYDLRAWCIMPNHVHVLLTPHMPLVGILKRLKGASARAINLKLGRMGPFWQDETFDRQIRDAEGFERVRRYIEYNPVAARLVAEPEDYRWSSAWRGAGHLARELVSTNSCP
jgi:REP element-mobilizing transposase RayT